MLIRINGYRSTVISPEKCVARKIPAMHNQNIWSIGLGTWLGLRVRLHMFMLLFATLTLYLCSVESEQVSAFSSMEPRDLSNSWIAITLLTTLVGSVLLHELSHVFCTLKLGGDVEEIVLWPLGGLGRVIRLADPQAELVAAAAGPMANLSLCLVTAIVLAIQGGTDISGLMLPFAPTAIMEGSGLIVILKLIFWVNWSLVLMNLIPAFPFDGQRIVRSIIQTGWPHLDEEFACTFTSRLAKLLGIALFLLGLLWFFAENKGNEFIPVWAPLMLMGIFIFFSARKDDFQLSAKVTDEESFLGYDFSEGYTSLERSQVIGTQIDEPSTLASWIQKRRDQQEERQREIEADEDGQVDEILERVHRDGFNSLSAEDRALLNRVSKRYQKRMPH